MFELILPIKYHHMLIYLSALWIIMYYIPLFELSAFILFTYLYLVEWTNSHTYTCFFDKKFSDLNSKLSWHKTNYVLFVHSILHNDLCTIEFLFYKIPFILAVLSGQLMMGNKLVLASCRLIIFAKEISEWRTHKSIALPLWWCELLLPWISSGYCFKSLKWAHYQINKGLLHS